MDIKVTYSVNKKDVGDKMEVVDYTIKANNVKVGKVDKVNGMFHFTPVSPDVLTPELSRKTMEDLKLKVKKTVSADYVKRRS